MSDINSQSDIAIIKEINIDKLTGWITMDVICNKCKNVNTHAISYISRETDDEIVIDFSNIDDTRECEQYTQSYDKCDAEYHLSSIILPIK